MGYLALKKNSDVVTPRPNTPLQLALGGNKCALWEGINFLLENNAHVEYLVVSPASFVRTLPSCLTAIKNWYMDIEASIATFLPDENNENKKEH